MAEPTDPGPVALDPELAASLVRLLNIRGPLGNLKVLDTIVPVVSLGDVVQSTVQVVAPAFRSSDVFSAGVQVAAAANTVHADTLSLAAGIYDVTLQLSCGENSLNTNFVLEHRNAANAANLMTIPIVMNSISNAASPSTWSFGYELALNERLRILNAVAMNANRRTAAWIMARIRS